MSAPCDDMPADGPRAQAAAGANGSPPMAGRLGRPFLPGLNRMASRVETVEIAPMSSGPIPPKAKGGQ